MTFTRRSLLHGGTALANRRRVDWTCAAQFAKALGAGLAVSAEPGAKLNRDALEAFRAGGRRCVQRLVAALRPPGTEIERVSPKPSRTYMPRRRSSANTGSVLAMVWGLHTLPQLIPPPKVLKMNDVADYLGKSTLWTDGCPYMQAGQ